jgi:antagonist of KipI
VTFLRDVTVAFVGIDHPRAGSPQRYRAGETLRFRGRAISSYGYLAVSGGFDVPEILGSASTDVRAGLGGRVLRVGDSLGQGKAVVHPVFESGQRVLWPVQPMKERLLTLRVLPGLQEEWFDEDSRESLRMGSFLKSAQFDRTGARLEGPSLVLEEVHELTSQPVVPGTIQVPPSGEPIVLTAECQTIGGYPVIAHIIGADLPAFIRALPGTWIRFHKVTLEEALEADRMRKRELAFLKTGLQLLQP